jgi:hypothetical protein
MGISSPFLVVLRFVGDSAPGPPAQPDLFGNKVNGLSNTAMVDGMRIESMPVAPHCYAIARNLLRGV